MNGRERTLATVRGEGTDIVPRVPILMQFAAEFIGSNYGAFASDHRVLVEANLRCAEHFDFDQVSAISDPYRETQGFGARIEFVRHGVPRCPRPPLAEDRDPARLRRPDPRRSERMRDRVRAIEAFAQAVRETHSILGWIEGPAAEAANLRGVTNFLTDLALEPAYADDLMARCVDVGVEFAKAQLDAGADTIGVGDAVVSQVSPATYERLIFPHEQRLFDGIHQAGGLVRLHICGDTTHLLPHMARLHVDVIDLDWQVDMAEARRVLGAGKVLTGNLDPANAVKASSPERIRSDLLAVYRAVGNPYMAGAGCEIPSGTPEANLRALCQPIPYEAPGPTHVEAMRK
ncbi:MAG: uroporphyrinogen decarboxylase family protein [Candidatus Brocadiia bacterium]